jgi:hypothetical protein
MARSPARDDDDDDDRRRHDAPAPKTVAAQPGVLTQPEPAIGSIPLVGATGVKGEHIVDGERDPDTIAEEQRIRSARYEAEGFDLGRKDTQSNTAETHRPPPPLQHQPAHKDDHHTTRK